MIWRGALAGLTLGAGQLAAQGIEVGVDLRLGMDDYNEFFSREGQADQVIYLRQLEAEFNYEMADDWKVELEAQAERIHGESEFELGDAHLSYTGLKPFDLTLGRVKEPFGLERLMSSSALPTNERSLVSTAFAPGRSYGLLVGKNKKQLTWHAGLFQEESQSNDASRAVTTRLTWAPILDEQDVVHVGGALSHRWHRGDAFQIRENGEVFSADSIIRSARIAADKRQLAGLELAWIHQSLTLSTEHHLQNIEDKYDVKWPYNGQYVQAGWIMTGENRHYANGLIKDVKPTHAYGAWEVVARHSRLDARDHAQGSVTTLRSIGLNAYFRHQLKFGLNLIDSYLRGDQRSPEDEGKAFTFRLQLQL